MNAPIPEQSVGDAELAAAMERAARSLDAAGLTVQDILDELPAAREELMHEWYSEEFLAQLDRALAEQRRTDT